MPPLKLAEFHVILTDKGAIKIYKILTDDSNQKLVLRNNLIAKVSHTLSNLIAEKDKEGIEVKKD